MKKLIEILKRVKIGYWIGLLIFLALASHYCRSCRDSWQESKEISNLKSQVKKLEKANIESLKMNEVKQTDLNEIIDIQDKEISRLNLFLQVQNKKVENDKVILTSELRKMKLTTEELLQEHEKKDILIADLRLVLTDQASIIEKTQAIADAWQKKFELKIQDEKKTLELLEKYKTLNQAYVNYRPRRKWFSVIAGGGFDLKGVFHPVLGFGITIFSI